MQAELLRVSSHEELLQAWLQQEEVQQLLARLLEFQREQEREQPQERVLPRLLQALQLACCALVWQLVLELLE